MQKISVLQQQLLSKFTTEEIEMESKQTLEVVGCFEVTVNGRLVHSKQNGDG